MKKILGILLSVLLMMSFSISMGCKKVEKAPEAPAPAEEAPAEEAPAEEGGHE